MKRIIGIVLIIVGVALAVVAFNRHDEDRTIIDPVSYTHLQSTKYHSFIFSRTK